MKHRFYYQGKEFGLVDNPLNLGSHVWICKCCSAVFASRVAEAPSTPVEGPFRYTIWDSLCADCLINHPNYQNERFTASFRLGGDASDQLPTMRAQFLYDSTYLGLT